MVIAFPVKNSIGLFSNVHIFPRTVQIAIYQLIKNITTIWQYQVPFSWIPQCSFQLFIHPHHALGRYLSPVCFTGTVTESQGSCMPGFKPENSSATGKKHSPKLLPYHCSVEQWVHWLVKPLQEEIWRKAKMVVLPSCTLPFLCQEKFRSICKYTPISHATI